LVEAVAQVTEIQAAQMVLQHHQVQILEVQEEEVQEEVLVDQAQ
jgi:hypothetical protein